MIGAIIGDTIGSAFEWKNVKRKDFEIINIDTHPTDDSVLTFAVADVLNKTYPFSLNEASLARFKMNITRNLVKWTRHYPFAGYGGRYIEWALGENHEPYNSFGNGSAMRISSVGWYASSEEEIKTLAKAVCEVTHNHPEGIKGGEAIAMAIYLSRIGKDKDYIHDYVVSHYYPRITKLNYDELVKHYRFDETCQGSVPEALYCFFISKDFEDCLRTSISIGGDSDTIACIACSVAEAYYKDIPPHLVDLVKEYLDTPMLKVLEDFDKRMKERN